MYIPNYHELENILNFYRPNYDRLADIPIKYELTTGVTSRAIIFSTGSCFFGARRRGGAAKTSEKPHRDLIRVLS